MSRLPIKIFFYMNVFYFDQILSSPPSPSPPRAFLQDTSPFCEIQG